MVMCILSVYTVTIVVIGCLSLFMPISEMALTKCPSLVVILGEISM